MPNKPTLASLSADLASGATSARRLVEECLAKIADPAGEGQRVFLHVDRDAALDAADAMDRLRKAKAAPSPFAGIPVSIKDLFDIKGQGPAPVRAPWRTRRPRKPMRPWWRGCAGPASS